MKDTAPWLNWLVFGAGWARGRLVPRRCVVMLLVLVLVLV
jgi:hypothetical protein